MAESVKVIVRCRPMNARENGLNCKFCISCDDSRNIVSIFKATEKAHQTPPKNFTFDGAYFTNSTTKQIYEDVGFALVDGVLEGYNGTVFAYGQTGCGKSYSMQGVPEPPEQRGIIPRAFEHIFEAIDIGEENTRYLVQASYLEIYNEEIRDLLGKDTKARLGLRESPDSGVYTQGLSQHIVKNISECLRLMEKGWLSRATGSTLMNAESSRSHSIFAIKIEMSTAVEGEEEEKIKVGKLNLVDLAGSERQGKTGATGERLREATKINLSLSALGNVISALVDGKSKHIPYRDSKLTRLLQDSLGGNTKTMMVACISPADNNYEETMSTLRYANRAKNIQNKPKINEDPKDALLREYAEEIKRLKEMLEGKIPLSLSGPVAPVTVITNNDERIKEEYEAKIAEINERYEEEKMSKMRLDEELRALRETYSLKLEEAESALTLDEVTSSKSKETSDMAISPLTVETTSATSATSTSSPVTGDQIYGEEKQVYDYTAEDDIHDVHGQSMDLQSVSSLTTPVPVTDEAADFTIQLTLSQAERLSVKQLQALSLNPSQRRILGYDGPVTAAHVSCLQLSAAQIMQLDLTEEQKSDLSPYQDAVVSSLEEQCEKMAAEQLSAFVTLLKKTKPIKLTVDQAQTLSNKQLASIVLSKEQKKQFGVEEAQALTLEQLSSLSLSPAQIAQLEFTDEQKENLSDEQYEVLLGVSSLLERQELLCILSDVNLKNVPTVKLTSEQATQLDPVLVQTMPLTDIQEQIIKEYKDSATEVEISDVDQLPLLPHQIKHLQITENMPDNLTKHQKKKVSMSIETQTKVEDTAVHNVSEMEETCTKTVTLTIQEANLLTKEQIGKVHVAVVSELPNYSEAGFAEPLTLTPLEIQQMQLTADQKQKIKAKKMKRIEKHGKIIKKLKKQSAALIELSVSRSTPEPHLTLTSAQARQVEGSVGPSKEQQQALDIEEGRTLDAEDLGGVVLSRAQISQLDISSKDQETVLEPQQKEQCLLTKQLNVQQDALKRLQEIAPLEELQLSLSDDQVKTLSTRQVKGLSLTEEQCEALGLVKGQSVSVQEISLITLNGEQVIQLRLSEHQRDILTIQQKVVMKSITARAVQELAYLNTSEEEGLLKLSCDQVSVLNEEQLARVILSDVQYAVLGVEKDHVLTREDLTKLSLTSSQIQQLALTAQQKCFLDQSQKLSVQVAEEHIEKTKTLQDALRIAGILPSGKSIANQANKTESLKEITKVNGKAIAEEGKDMLNVKVTIQLTAEQASILTREQLSHLKLTQSQLDRLGMTEDEELTPSQIAQINFTQSQILSLGLTPSQLQTIPAGLGTRPKTPPMKTDSSKKNKSIMPRVLEMPHTEAATEISDNDKSEAIKMHQAALEKLQQLQSQMVQGGVDEGTTLKENKKKEIKEKMKRRREAAEAKKRKLRKAMEEGDDDGVIEELFTFQMEEVEVRNRKLGKIKEKYKEKVTEIQDLTEEFQVQREDYLESIRDQSKESKLLAQILEQIQPLLRRDCNYYNMDKIKRDCQWNLETEEWFIPPVMISKTKVPTLSELPHKGPAPPQSSYYDAPDDTRIRHKLSTSENSDYFKSKRAQQLLHDNKYLSNGNFSGPSNRLFIEENGRNVSRNVLDPIDSTTYNNDKHSKKKKSSRGRLYPI